MKKAYNPKSIEPKWQKAWAKSGVYRQYGRKMKFYVLDMFPYPSGAGLHVGHPKGYIATDVLARMKQLQGYAVLHPMGWDAFGLPAEQFALKHKVHPEKAVKENIVTFKRQLGKIGFTYDWEREINTTDPAYYKWTQWIFLKLWEKGLAYESEDPINWCPSCMTGLANEDLEQGRCERCGSSVEKRPMRQWVLRMTKYADRLLRDLDTEKLEWSESIKEQQRNWIGRSEGAEVIFYVADTEEAISVYTTRIDTIFGCTYLVLAPEHILLKNQETRIQNQGEVKKYIKKTLSKSDLERTGLTKDKTGVKLEGIEAVNPFTGRKVPIYVADYVLGSYGTGAVMAVPAHDERDFEFATNYNLSISPVILRQSEESRSYVMGVSESDILDRGVNIVEKTKDGFFKVTIPYEQLEQFKTFVRERMRPGFWNDFSTENGFYFIFKHKDGRVEEMELNKKTNDLIDRYGMTFNGKKPKAIPENVYSWLAKNSFYQEILIHTEDGVLVNSGEFTGLKSSEAREKMTAWLKKEKLGKKKVNYKMRDWAFSRQRYWGEPIPLIHCESCGVVAIPEKDLPVLLPKVKSYEPTGTGESPLASIKSWVNVKCPKCLGPAKRETNTMPQWAGSCWYYLRYIDPHNKKALVDKKKEKKMMPVDVYVGGTEHATRHLLYARFWHKFLYDIKAVSGKEPFKKLVNQGLILASDGRKMSKRWNNVINPDDMVAEFGADAFRVYEMFMGPFTQSIAWNTDGVVGTRRFLEKVWKLQGKIKNQESRIKEKKIESLLHKTIKKVAEDIEGFKFNTAVSALMILVNVLEKEEKIEIANYKPLLLLLSPFAPHIAEELWCMTGEKKSIFLATWPKWDKKKIVEEMKTIVVQVNGKVRATFEMTTGSDEETVKAIALGDVKVQTHVAGKEIRKVIYIQDKILNLVV